MFSRVRWHPIYLSKTPGNYICPIFPIPPTHHPPTKKKKKKPSLNIFAGVCIVQKIRLDLCTSKLLYQICVYIHIYIVHCSLIPFIFIYLPGLCIFYRFKIYVYYWVNLWIDNKSTKEKLQLLHCQSLSATGTCWIYLLMSQVYFILCFWLCIWTWEAFILTLVSLWAT